MCAVVANTDLFVVNFQLVNDDGEHGPLSNRGLNTSRIPTDLGVTHNVVNLNVPFL